MQAGDLVFCHSAGLIGKAIRVAEWLRFRRGSKFNHVAQLYKPTEDGKDWYVIQAEAKGVTKDKRLSTIAPGGAYVVVPSPCNNIKGCVTTEDQLDFAIAQVGDKYGFLTIASIVVSLLLPRFINVMLPNTWICSAVAAESLRCGGWVHNWPNIYQVSPAQLWEAVSPVGVKLP